MATLTTSYQKVAETYLGNISGYGNLYLRLFAKYNSQSTENNSTVVARELRIYNAGTYCYSGNCNAYLDGTKTIDNQRLDFNQGTEILIGTKTSTVTHSSDGSGSIHITGSFDCYAGTNGSVNVWCDLPKINRKAKINSFSGNDINGSFNVTYTKYTNSFTYKLRLSIPNITTLETISSYSSGTAINLSATSLNKIYTNVTNSKTVKIGAVIETWNGSTKIGESSEIINVCNISNSLPSIGDITYADTNTDVVAITGNNQIILESASTIQFNISSISSCNQATLVSISIQLGNNTTTINLSGTSEQNKTINYGRTYLEQNATALFTLTDSRGFTATKSVNLTINPYSSIYLSTFEFSRVTQVSDVIKLNMAGTFYNNNLGSVANELSIKYRYKEANSDTWESYTTIVPTISSNNFSYTNNSFLSGLVYSKSYDFEFVFADKINETVLKRSIIKSIPVMDLGEEDVEFNYEAYKQGGKIVGETVLYSSQGSTGQITLEDSVSNYNRIKIFGFMYIDGENFMYFGKEIDFPLLGCNTDLTGVAKNGSTNTYLISESITLISDEIQRGQQYLNTIGTSVTRTSGSYVFITKVIGIK